LGLGVWAPTPNPQSPIPNPQSPIPNPQFQNKIKKLEVNYFLIVLKIKFGINKNNKNGKY
jgi:hypothetical protein